MKFGLFVLMNGGLIAAREPLLAKNATPLLIHQKPAYGDYPVDYFVPHFGKDIDIAASLKNTKDEEKRQKHVINFMNEPIPVNSIGDQPHPINYKVPNFGPDIDIAYTKQNIANAESQIGHKMIADFGLKDGVPRNYPVADFGQDGDIKTSLKNSASWNPTPEAVAKIPTEVEFKLMQLDQ